MTASAFPHSASLQTARHVSAPALRLWLTLIVAGAVGLGFYSTSPEATAQAVSTAGEDLTRLLRAMAFIKAGMALIALAAVFWRLATAVSVAQFSIYAAASAGMAAGPGLICGMAHVGLGALLLHTGLFIGVIVLWHDPSVSGRLAAIVSARRSRHHPNG